ncbi:hypothetical protein JW872_01245 [Candidatus Babeliales bacterium]|nr:hypothetical protein [Candidatus Babeliales bacterium]
MIKRSLILTVCLASLCTQQANARINMRSIRAHQEKIRLIVLTKTLLKTSFNTAMVTAVLYAGYESIFGNAGDTTTKNVHHHDNAQDLMVEYLRKLVAIFDASDPSGRKFTPWFWSTDETRTALRKFALGTAIATIAYRFGISELYRELLGKCSPYDAVTLFLEEKTRINKLLGTLDHYTSCYAQYNISEADQSYCQESLAKTLQHLERQCEYLLGYMYYRGGNNHYKRRAVDTMRRDMNRFFTTVEPQLHDSHERINLQKTVRRFCSWFHNEIINFSNLDALE